MSTNERTPAAGCAVCNPDLARPIEEIFEEHRKEIEQVLHVARIGEGYHVLQIPGERGAPCKDWMGPFVSERAARNFRESLISNALEGNPNNACCSGGVLDHFNIVDRILSVIEAHDGDSSALAKRLANEEPWNLKRSPTPTEVEFDVEIPF